MLIHHRLWIAALTIAGTYVVTGGLGNSGFPTKFAESQFSIGDLPLKIGEWTGADFEVDEWIVGEGDFRQVLDRVYRRSIGSGVHVHLAVLRPMIGGKLPHMPEICYRGTGHVLIEGKNFDAESDPEIGVTARLVTFEGQGRRSRVLYWYQFNNEKIVDRQTLQKATWAVRGQPAWPPMLKVMLSVDDESVELSNELLFSLAKQIAEWSKDFE